ncbi:uncharacterized protein LOC135401432 [Ornithodoros turicata]|uniref:uncharacterized protein LOC135401432 n=1 Tax=Ornithodoros turicata TaxID=34597 RepID=UPI003139E954
METNDLPTKPMPLVQQQMMALTRSQVGYHCVLQRSLRFDPNFYLPTRLREGLRLTFLFYCHGPRPRLHLYMYEPDSYHRWAEAEIVQNLPPDERDNIRIYTNKPWPAPSDLVEGVGEVRQGTYIVLQWDHTWSQAWKWEIHSRVNDYIDKSASGEKEYDRLWTDPYCQGDMLLMEYHMTQTYQQETTMIYAREMVLPVKYGFMNLHPGSVVTVTAKATNLEKCGPRVEISLLQRGGDRATSRQERRRIHSLGDAQPETYVTITLMASVSYVRVFSSFSDKVVFFSPQEDTAGYAFHFFCNIDMIDVLMDAGAWYYSRW